MCLHEDTCVSMMGVVLVAWWYTGGENGTTVGSWGQHPTDKLYSLDETAFTRKTHAAPPGECN